MIKNLMFDLGGVIMDIDRRECVKAFEKLGMKDADSFFGEYRQTGAFLSLEAGDITPAEFRDSMRRSINTDVTDDTLDRAINRFLTGIPVDRLRQLEQLRRHYKIYLLSNTNPIMWDGRIASQFKKDGHDINHYFDDTLTSFEARVNKPDRRIFLRAIDKFGIQPDQTIFIDDSQANLDAAAALGFHTLLIPPATEFYYKINEYEHNNKG